MLFSQSMLDKMGNTFYRTEHKTILQTPEVIKRFVVECVAEKFPDKDEDDIATALDNLLKRRIYKNICKFISYIVTS